MLHKRKYYPFFVLLMICCHLLTAQPPAAQKKIDTIAMPSISSTVKVGEIVIAGNKKTKKSIILREIPFKSGEEYSLDEIVKKFETARRQLMNTALFNAVIVAAKNIEGNPPSGQASKIDVIVEVRERWYLFPVPYFVPVDRNLNQWIVENRASFDRVDYGLNLFYNNATGTNDKLSIGLIRGYTKRFSFGYDRLYIDKKLKWGMKFTFATGKNREVNYNTINNKQVFIKDENQYLRKFINTSAELTYRKAINTRHSFGIGYVSELLMDTVVSLNPFYFTSGRKSIRFPSIYYTLNYSNVNNIAYPTKGYVAQVSIKKNGFNSTINVWQLYVKGLASWPISAKTFFHLNVYGGIKLPFRQPYFNQRLFGYGDVYMQGFEYYVVDGVACGYLKTTLSY